MATDADDWGTWRGQWLQAVAGDASLPHGAAAVAVFLAHKYADARTRTCWPSVATLAAEMGQQTRKRAQAAVTALSAAGYLDKRPGGGRASGSTKGAVRGASNFYRLTMPTGQPTAGTPANLTVPDTAHLTTVTVPEMAQLDTVNCPRNRLLTVPNRGHEPFHRTPPIKRRGNPPTPCEEEACHEEGGSGVSQRPAPVPRRLPREHPPRPRRGGRKGAGGRDEVRVAREDPPGCSALRRRADGRRPSFHQVRDELAARSRLGSSGRFGITSGAAECDGGRNGGCRTCRRPDRGRG